MATPAMTGGKATASPAEGGAFTAWDGYISGRNLVLEPGRRIVQSWRTTRFTAEDPDSQIEVLLEPVAGGTRLTLHHTNVPDGHTGYQDGGWQDHYFEPMKRWFENLSRLRRERSRRVASRVRVIGSARSRPTRCQQGDTHGARRRHRPPW